MIYSATLNRYYVGQTNNLYKRLAIHINIGMWRSPVSVSRL
ncbi:GIY-YIG nuclease family protein [Tamlana sp. I1]